MKIEKTMEKYLGNVSEGRKEEETAFNISGRKIKSLKEEKKRLSGIIKGLSKEVKSLEKYLKLNMITAIRTAWDKEQLLEIEEYLSDVDTALDKLL